MCCWRGTHRAGDSPSASAQGSAKSGHARSKPHGTGKSAKRRQRPFACRAAAGRPPSSTSSRARTSSTPSARTSATRSTPSAGGLPTSASSTPSRFRISFRIRTCCRRSRSASSTSIRDGPMPCSQERRASASTAPSIGRSSRRCSRAFGGRCSVTAANRSAAAGPLPRPRRTGRS